MFRDFIGIGGGVGWFLWGWGGLEGGQVDLVEQRVQGGSGAEVSEEGGVCEEEGGVCRC